MGWRGDGAAASRPRAFSSALTVALVAAAAGAPAFKARERVFDPAAGAVAVFPEVDCDAFVFTTAACSCDTVIHGAVVVFERGYSGRGDTLASTAAGGTIDGTFDARRGELVLAGRASVREYTTAVRGVEFTAVDASSPRVISYTLGHAAYDPVTQHFYQRVVRADTQWQPCSDTRGDEGCAWATAQAFCADLANDLFGLVGYLVTITSEWEDQIVMLRHAAVTRPTAMWMGLADIGREGTWRWVAGPEGCPPYNWDPATSRGPTRSACDLGFPFTVPGDDVCSGTQCDVGSLVGERSSGSGSGFTPATTCGYTRWASNSPAARDVASPGEYGLDAARLGDASGEWADAPLDYTTSPLGTSVGPGFVCEFGGVGELCIATQSVHQRVRLVDASAARSGTLDECAASCPTCAEGACGAAQTCVDTDTSANALGDWVCECGGYQVVDAPAAAGAAAWRMSEPAVCAAACATARPFGALSCGGFEFAGGCGCATVIRGAHAWVEDGLQQGDLLQVDPSTVAAAGPDVKEMYHSEPGILELTGAATIGAYTSILRSLQFTAGDAAGRPRRVMYNFGHGLYRTHSQHFYRHAIGTQTACDGSNPACAWTFAQESCAAAGNDLLGLVGYLATVTSSREQRTLADSLLYLKSAYSGEDFEFWIGLADATEGEYRWVTGPEGCPPYDTAAVGAARSACDLGFPLADPLSGYTGPDVGRGTIIGVDTGVDVSAPPCAFMEWDVGLAQPLPDERRDFVRMTRSGWRVARVNPVNIRAPKRAAWFCEWGGVGEACMRTGLVGDSLLANGDTGRIPTGTRTTPSTLDECTAPCPTCAGSICSGAGQACEDPTKNTYSLADWRCLCKDAPSYKGSAKAAAAVCEDCRIDECDRTHSVVWCTTCADGTCEAAMPPQECMDPDHSPAALGDWECRCMPPGGSNTAVGAVADCSVLDECTAGCATCALATCSDFNQTCEDPQQLPNATGDWRCVCAPPSTRDALTAAAPCEFNECDAACATCAGSICDSAGQTCNDPNPVILSLSDWVCRCAAPADQTAVTTAADCSFDECSGACATCANTTCDDVGQRCADADLATPDSWVCECTTLGDTVVAGVVAECPFDECSGRGAAVCGAANQTCEDPDTTAGAVGDFVCSCRVTGGSAVAAPATCTLDECRDTCATCADGVCATADPPQACEDPTDSETALGDWLCVCPAPSLATAAGTLANCVFNECTEMCTGCAMGACAAAGQVCEDADDRVDALGDWYCECPSPATAVAKAMAVASCAYDECVEGTNASGSAAGAGGGGGGGGAPTRCPAFQTCNDPETSPASLGDWQCTCVPPATGTSITAAPAVCALDECSVPCDTCANATCTDAGQTCNDPSKEDRRDWVCACSAPSNSTAAAAAAACRLDECEATCDSCANGVCSADGQACVDPSQGVAETGDWVCTCPAPSTLTAIGRAVADCAKDECAAYGGTCAAGGQTCEDAKGDDAWYCVCVDGRDGKVLRELRGLAGCEGDFRGMSKEDRETLGTTNTVAAAATALGGGAASGGGGGRLVLLSSFGCQMDDVDLSLGQPIDWEFHPTRIAIGQQRIRHLLGASLMNPLVIFGFLVMTHLVSRAMACFYGISIETAKGNTRSPGATYIPYLFLLQGTSLVGARLMFAARVVGTSGAVLGAMLLIGCIASPVGLYYFVLRRIPAEAVSVPDPRLDPDAAREYLGEDAELPPPLPAGCKRTTYTISFGNHIWVGRNCGYFCEQFGPVFENIKDGKTWWVLAEIGVILGLSCFSAWKPDTLPECTSRNTLISIMLLVYFVYFCRHRPYSACLDNLVCGGVAGMTLIAVICMTIGIGISAGVASMWFVISKWMLLLSAVFLFIKVIYDMFFYFIDVWIGRRSGARSTARQARGGGDALERTLVKVNTPGALGNASVLEMIPLQGASIDDLTRTSPDASAMPLLAKSDREAYSDTDDDSETDAAPLNELQDVSFETSFHGGVAAARRRASTAADGGHRRSNSGGSDSLCSDVHPGSPFGKFTTPHSRRGGAPLFTKKAHPRGASGGGGCDDTIQPTTPLASRPTPQRPRTRTAVTNLTTLRVAQVARPQGDVAGLTTSVRSSPLNPASRSPSAFGPSGSQTGSGKTRRNGASRRGKRMSGEDQSTQSLRSVATPRSLAGSTAVRPLFVGRTFEDYNEQRELKRADVTAKDAAGGSPLRVAAHTPPPERHTPKTLPPRPFERRERAATTARSPFSPFASPTRSGNGKAAVSPTGTPARRRPPMPIALLIPSEEAEESGESDSEVGGGGAAREPTPRAATRTAWINAPDPPARTPPSRKPRASWIFADDLAKAQQGVLFPIETHTGDEASAATNDSPVVLPSALEAPSQPPARVTAITPRGRRSRGMAQFKASPLIFASTEL